MAALPPWLDVTPAQFGQAAAEGARIRLQRAQLQQSAAESAAQLQQSAAATAQQLGLRKQLIAATEQKTAQQNQLKQDTLMSNFLRAQTQASVSQAYQNAQLGMEKQRLQDTEAQTAQAHQDKAKEISDTVGYANAIATGTAPLAARSQFPLAKLPAAEEKSANPPMSDYAKAMHSDLASAYKDALKTGDITKVGAAAKYLREFDEKQNPQGLVQPSPGSAGVPPAVPGVAPGTSPTAPAGGTGFIGTPGGANQFVNPAATFQAAAGQAGTPGTAPATTPSPSNKVALANQIAQQHPDWTKQQVIDAVNEQQ